MRYEVGLSKQIAMSCSISRTAVAGYLRRAEAGVTWPIPEGMHEARLERLIFPPLRPLIPAQERSVSDWAEIHGEQWLLAHRKSHTLSAEISICAIVMSSIRIGSPLSQTVLAFFPVLQAELFLLLPPFLDLLIEGLW